MKRRSPEQPSGDQRPSAFMARKPDAGKVGYFNYFQRTPTNAMANYVRVQEQEHKKRVAPQGMHAFALYIQSQYQEQNTTEAKTEALSELEANPQSIKI